jgi:hypothetical protein
METINEGSLFMSRPHPTTCLYHVPELEFISDSPLVISNKISWKNYSDPIAIITPKLKSPNVTIPIMVTGDYSSSSIPLQLFTGGKRSQVGKGKLTVLDESVRKSKEFSAKHIQLSSEFKKWVKETVTEGAISLHHPYPVRAHLYKLLIYGKGGRFKSHIDSPHSSGMIMTFSVDIWCGDRSGGELKFESRAMAIGNEAMFPEPGEIVSHLFYHDVAHKLTVVQAGWKMSLVFDVCQVPFSSSIHRAIMESRADSIPNENTILNISNDYFTERAELLGGLKYLKSVGAKRVGFPLKHIYMCPDDMELSVSINLPDYLHSDLANLIIEYCNFIVLKGVDKIIANVATELELQPRIIKICCENQTRIYDERLINIFKLHDTFDSIYNECYGSDPEENGDNDKYRDFDDEKYSNGTRLYRSFKSGDKFEPSMDRHNASRPWRAAERALKGSSPHSHGLRPALRSFPGHCLSVYSFPFESISS